MGTTPALNEAVKDEEIRLLASTMGYHGMFNTMDTLTGSLEHLYGLIERQVPAETGARAAILVAVQQVVNAYAVSVALDMQELREAVDSGNTNAVTTIVAEIKGRAASRIAHEANAAKRRK